MRAKITEVEICCLKHDLCDSSLKSKVIVWHNLFKRGGIKKVILAVFALVALSGCTALENTWSAGKTIGGAVLSEPTKEKLKPLVDSTETIYSTGKEIYTGK